MSNELDDLKIKHDILTKKYDLMNAKYQKITSLMATLIDELDDIESDNIKLKGNLCPKCVDKNIIESITH